MEKYLKTHLDDDKNEIRGYAMKKKFKNIFFILLLAFIVLLLVSGFLLKRYVTPERVHAFIVPEIEEALQRKVAIGDIAIGIFKGIDIREFSIKESDGISDFVTCENFVLKFKLLPLLSRNVVIDKMILKGPDIRIKRNVDNTYNFSDIAKKEESRQTEKGIADDPSKRPPISLLISNVSLDKARFSFIDLKKELPDVAGSISAQLSLGAEGVEELFSSGRVELNIDEALIHKPSAKQVKNITAELDYGFLIKMAAQEILIDTAKLRIQDIPASVSGSIKNFEAAPEIDLNVSVSKVETAEVLKLISSFVEVTDIRVEGGITADMNISGMVKKPESISASGTMQLDKVRALYKDMHISTNGNLRISPTKVVIEPSDVAFQGIPASLAGTIANFRSSPEVDLSFTIPRTDAAQAQNSLKSLVASKGLGLSGFLSADIKVTGKTKDLKSLEADGNVRLENLGIAYRDMNTVIDGTVQAAGQSVTFDVKTTVGKNSADLEGTVKNLFANQQIQLSIRSEKIHLDELFAAAIPKEKAAREQENTASEKSEVQAKPLKGTFSARGDIRIDNALYGNLNMSNFAMDYQMQNNTLRITRMSAGIGKGSIDMKSAVDFSRPGYTYSMTGKVNSVHAQELVNALAPKATDTLFGVITSQFNLNGAGTTPKSIRNTLAGKGNFSLTDGKLTNSKLPEKLAQFLGIPELRTIKLKKATGDITISNGYAQLTSIFRSDDLSMDPSGKIGLDKTLDLEFDLKLSPPLTKKITFDSNIARYIKDEEGWGTIPLAVTGTFASPSYGVNVEKAGKRVIKEKGKKLLEKLFEKDKDKQVPAESTGEPVKDDKKPVEDLIKGLFK
jgi:AsmA protein